MEINLSDDRSATRKRLKPHASDQRAALKSGCLPSGPLLELTSWAFLRTLFLDPKLFRKPVDNQDTESRHKILATFPTAAECGLPDLRMRPSSVASLRPRWPSMATCKPCKGWPTAPILRRLTALTYLSTSPTVATKVRHKSGHPHATTLKAPQVFSRQILTEDFSRTTSNRQLCFAGRRADAQHSKKFMS